MCCRLCVSFVASQLVRFTDIIYYITLLIYCRPRNCLLYLSSTAYYALILNTILLLLNYVLITCCHPQSCTAFTLQPSLRPSPRPSQQQSPRRVHAHVACKPVVLYTVSEKKISLLCLATTLTHMNRFW